MFNWINRLFNKKTNIVESDFDSVIDFRQGLELTEIPICTFRQGDKKLNFLLDTGANNNVLDSRVLKDVKYNLTNYHTSIMGMEGVESECSVIKMGIEHEEVRYDTEFRVCDMSDSFDAIRAENGVILHGIIGSNFFREHKSIFDFEHLKAYFKKNGVSCNKQG